MEPLARRGSREQLEGAAVAVQRSRPKPLDVNEVTLKVRLAQVVGRKPQPVAKSVLDGLTDAMNASTQARHVSVAVAPEVSHPVEDVDVPHLIEAVFGAERLAMRLVPPEGAQRLTGGP